MSSSARREYFADSQVHLLEYPPPLSFPTPCPSPGEGWTVTCSTQNCSLQLTVLLWQNHHPRVLPKAFQWKVVSTCKSLAHPTHCHVCSHILSCGTIVALDFSDS